MLSTEYYFASVRKPEDAIHEFFNISEIDCLRELVEASIKENAKNIPGWHKANPVQRIVRIKIEELPE